MNNKQIYYSCCTWLAYQISERYYGGNHYVWCAPYFDPPSRFNVPNHVPPTSSPKEIYTSLKQEVSLQDRHSVKITQNRLGIQRGADFNCSAGIIDESTRSDIIAIAEEAQLNDFRPLILVIPLVEVEALLTKVPLKDLAGLFSEEFIISKLPRKSFDAIEF